MGSRGSMTTTSFCPPSTPKRIRGQQREESAPGCWPLGGPRPCILALHFSCESGNTCVQEGRCSGREMVLRTPKCATCFGGREADVTAPPTPPPASSGSPGGLSRQSSHPPGQPSPVHFLNGTPAQTLGTSLTCLVVVELRVTSPQTPPFSMTRRDCFSLPPAPGLR